jgi:hypothetical protein
MRTKTLLAAAAMMAAGLASSMAQSNVYSLNVVGYVNYTFKGGGLFTATASPLNTSNTLAGVFGTGSPLTGLPAGSSVQVWDTTLQDFVPYTKTPVGSGWGANATVPIVPGKGVFVRINTAGDYTNTYVGEVLQGSLTNSTGVNFNLIGNMVPDSGLATAVNLVPAPGATVQKWSVALQDFVLSTKTPIGWSGAGEPSFVPGDGFFLRNTTPYNWVRNFTVQ